METRDIIEIFFLVLYGLAIAYGFKRRKVDHWNLVEPKMMEPLKAKPKRSEGKRKPIWHDETAEWTKEREELKSRGPVL